MNERRKVIVLVILSIILVISWIIVLKPTKKKKNRIKINISMDENISEEPVFGGINIREVERSISEVKDKIEEISKRKGKSIRISLRRNPFYPLVKKKEPEKKEKKEEEIIPDFVISGILYDEEKPMAIINDKVVSEGDFIFGWEVVDIEKGSVLIGRGNKFFYLTMKKRILGGENEKKKETYSGNNTDSSLYRNLPPGIM